jgi:hypothetical protein
MRAKFFTFTIVFIALTGLALAQQNNEEIKPNTIINIYPQHLVLNGIRADVELNEANSKLRILIGGVYYNRFVNKNGQMLLSNKINSFYSSELHNDKATGIGLNFGLMQLINSRERHTGIKFINQFIGSELQYRSHLIKFNDFDYVPKVVDGITFYNYELTDFKGTATQTAITLFYGYEALMNFLVINFKLGAAYYYASQDVLSKDYRDFGKEGLFSPAYNGFAPYALFGVGFRLE